jgi:hypothetical protein
MQFCEYTRIWCGHSINTCIHANQSKSYITRVFCTNSVPILCSIRIGNSFQKSFLCEILMPMHYYVARAFNTYYIHTNQSKSYISWVMRPYRNVSEELYSIQNEYNIMNITTQYSRPEFWLTRVYVYTYLAISSQRKIISIRHDHIE